MSSVIEQLRAALALFISDPETLNEAVEAVASTSGVSESTASVDGALVDLDRESRCGFPEVVYGEGKPADLIARIISKQQAVGQDSLVTRVTHEQAEHILGEFPQARHNPIARTVSLIASDGSPETEPRPAAAIVSAGSSDAAVAQEALETLRWMKVPAVLVEDVGVAGPQRLQQNLSLLQSVRVIVCVAGMEAALPSVVGGYVRCPVIGVPTSVGYGASLGGITALLSMLTCCASNVVTVNIDAGFRGGYVAGMIVRNAE